MKIFEGKAKRNHRIELDLSDIHQLFNSRTLSAS